MPTVVALDLMLIEKSTAFNRSHWRNSSSSGMPLA